MSFDTYGASQTGNTNTENTVDFNELNKYVVETAKLEEREVLCGTVSMIVDLGFQDQPDAELKFDGDAAEEEKIIAEYPDTYFKDGIDQQTKKPCRLKCFPQKPVQCVAVACDFPDVVLDKGKFFGESKPLPLRLWLGGQFYKGPDVGMTVARPTALKVNKKLGDWSLAQNHLFHKMAVAEKLIKPDEVFHPSRIDELLGKTFQFEVQVYFKEGKGGKSYYTEYIKFVSGLGRGQTAKELPFEPLLVQFNVDNPPEAIKDLRSHIINTIKCANNYEGSKIQKQIEELRGGNKQVEKKEESSKQESKPVKNKPQPKPEPVNINTGTPDLDDGWDDDKL